MVGQLSELSRCLVFLAIAATLFAQQKPNFTGTWKQDNAKSQFAGLPAPISVVDSITHKEPDLHLTQTVVGPQGDSITSEHDYSTDGRERPGKSPNYTERNVVKWDASALVFVSTRDYKGREVVIRERWELSPDGKSMRKERWSLAVKQIFVLEKQ